MLEDGWKKLNNRMMIQYIRNKILYASEDHFIWKSENNGQRWTKVCQIENIRHGVKYKIKNLLLRSKIIRRLRKNIGIHNLVVLKSGTILIQYDGIYRYDRIGKFAKYVYSFKNKHIKTPLINGFIIDDKTGNVYFGEYNNERPYSVKIIRGTNDGRDWEVCYCFSRGEIKHVHSIVPDKYRDCIWICAGDNNEESGLFYTDNDFQTLKKINGGSQKWRMIGMVPLENGLVWGSDAGKDADINFKNHIYYWDLKQNKPEELACIDKPAYYSMSNNNGEIVIGTTYEPGMKRPLKPSSELWYSPQGLDWQRIASFSFKPSRRKNSTKYCTLNFPLGDNSQSDFFMTPENVELYDLNLLRWEPKR